MKKFNCLYKKPVSRRERGAKAKRCAALAATVFVLFWSFCAATGCAALRGADLLGYCDGELSASVRLTYNGAMSEFRYTEAVNELGSVSALAFTAPEELVGFSLRSEIGRTVVICEGLEAEAPEALALIPMLMKSVFSLDSASVRSITSEQTDGMTFTAVGVDGLKVLLGEEGTPVMIEGVFRGAPFTAHIGEFSGESDGELLK